MYRWHESGCRRPDVSTASGLPCCSYCFAIPSLEDYVVPSLPLPQVKDRRQMSLAWPAAVTYSDWESKNESRRLQDGSQDETPGSGTPRSLLPELPSEDCIRLLRLKPGIRNAPIHANFEIVRIDQIPLPLYEALSYTSVSDPADPHEPCPVFIGSYWDVVYVPTNCGKALRRFRRQKVDRLLWVDSLCINHASLDGKNSQVHILRDIYSRATKVLAYVGDEPSNLAPAFSFLKEITVFTPTPQVYPTILDKNTRTSLSALLKQPYFSRLWVLQETLMARELEISCGELSARWPKRPFGEACSDLDIPPWLFRDSKWYPFTGSELLNVLLDASRYQCSDPRDKVFAVLGLMGEKLISPDYRLSTEGVYVGIAAYLMKSWHTMDFLALAGQKNRAFDLPSWVPDWSQSLSLPSLDTFLRPGTKVEPEDFLMGDTVHIKFGNLITSRCEIEVSSATGTIRVQGVKMCSISGEMSQFRDYTHIQMPSGSKGSCMISIPHQRYEMHESDSLFLLNGYNHPVILREGTIQGTYTLIAACVLSIGAPTPDLLIPWYRTQGRMKSSSFPQLNVSALPPEDDNSLQQLYWRMQSIPDLDTPSAATIRTRVLSFLILSHTAIQRVENSLRADWNKWNQELGWMFRDQSAIWQFLCEVNQLNPDQRTGEGRINLKVPEYISTSTLGRYFQSVYTWDLTRFCWSFLQPTDPTQSNPEIQWSPMVGQLRTHLPEIQKWAQVTEKLVKVFEYTAASLGEAWESFPGSQLQRKWSRNYEEFLAVSTPNVQRGMGMHQRPHLQADHLWNVSEFESQLRAREGIWALRTADERRWGDGNIAAHALLNFLGFDLYNEQCIDIV
ncbi:heterokaryon incompatibility protein-domain-containing protein [Aspergillus aurantiobrunneus]